MEGDPLMGVGDFAVTDTHSIFRPVRSTPHGRDIPHVIREIFGEYYACAG